MGIFNKKNRRQRIKRRIKKTVTGTAERPRLSIYRSNKQIYAQLIDDLSGSTLLAASSIDDKSLQNIPKVEQAKLVGTALAQKAQKAGINHVVFDRNGFLYHGRLKSFAEAAREGGLIF